ncbi:MAG: hypothetical protein J1F13_05660 [Prevotellaceae bacterium]|nr:hypothetical protein [Prevotellaceae bacterium]
MTLRKYLLAVICLTLSALFAPTLPQAMAQQQGRDGRRFSPEEFKQKIEAFITEQAKLTPQEAQKLLPLYHAMRNEQRKLLGERNHIMREADKGNLSEKDAQKTLERANAIDRQMLDIGVDYQKKMLKIVSASKLLSVQAAEKRFERNMLRRMASPPKEARK